MNTQIYSLKTSRLILLSEKGIYFLILLLTFFLSSCSHHMVRPDGAPNFYVDESRIPNAVPKYEARAKYGNMPSYVTLGKRYYTLKSSKNYEAVGIASWYGTKFHARRTSSGERYNMLGMTAAHKTLPLPTYVEVTNLRNHRTIIVKVNDRGPFLSNRLIDLSYVAAKKLGMMGHGTALVKVKAIDPGTFDRTYPFAPYRQPPRYGSEPQLAKRSPLPAARHLSTSSLYVQAGAFRSRNHAEHLQQRLTRLLAMPVEITYPSVHEKWYRVKVGPLKDVMAANRIHHQLKKLGIK